MSARTLAFISPHGARAGGLPTRPSSLLAGFIEVGAFHEVVIVNRLRPTSFAAQVAGGRLIACAGLAAIRRRLTSGATLIEHPWPFGALERRFLHGLLATLARGSDGGVVAWIADPKSVPAAVGNGHGRPWRVVVDIYDAWDRSPLVRGDRRRRAVVAGYRAAASGADLVFANTPTMRDRILDLGARDARLLPNACPSLDPRAGLDRRGGGLVYVGRIHERFDTALVGAVADALPTTMVTIAGPVERKPRGWSSLQGRPNVSIQGRTEHRAARDLIAGAAALIVPHVVDDYTRSQDAMKAWDAMASGTPVISTPIPPVDLWPTGLAEVCPDVESFVAAACSAVEGDLEGGRARRSEFAAQNQWSARAREAAAAIESLTTDVEAGRP